jgi:prolyl 4-hydroxylase
MTALQHAQELARQGQQSEAVALVECAAQAGDPDALLALAQWKLHGIYGARDLAKAHELLAAAAARGNLEAARTRANLVGNGTGCTSSPAQASLLLHSISDRDPLAAFQVAFMSTMKRLDEAKALSPRIMREDPPIRLIPGLLSTGECRYLTTLAEPALQRSYVIDPRNGRRLPHPVRTSSGMSFGPAEEDLVIHALNQRIAAVTRTQVRWGEPLHLLRYSTGEEYKPHIDALPGESNQRDWTVIIYLNQGFEGGGTRFTDLGLEIVGDEGDALIFRNTMRDGRPDPRTRHAGLPVTAGVKWIATRWIRRGAYDPWAPQLRNSTSSY